jgi:hypothetical protein
LLRQSAKAVMVARALIDDEKHLVLLIAVRGRGSEYSTPVQSARIFELSA